jgi:hypothetical protein
MGLFPRIQRQWGLTLPSGPEQESAQEKADAQTPSGWGLVQGPAGWEAFARCVRPSGPGVRPRACLLWSGTGMVHQHIGNADAQGGHEHVVVTEGFHHGGAEAAGQAALLHRDHPADAARQGQDQGLIEGPQEAGIHHRGPHPLLLQQAGGGQGGIHHRAIGHDQQVVAIGEQFTPADLQGLKALLPGAPPRPRHGECAGHRGRRAGWR